MSTFNTQQLPSYLSELTWEAMYAKVVTDQCADLATADTFALLPITGKMEIMRGAKSKAKVATSGFTRRVDSDREDKLVITMQQRDPATLILANQVLANLNRQKGMVLFLFQLSRFSLSAAGTIDFFIVGPCFPDKETGWKIPGSDIDLTAYPQPCASAYAGLSSADITALNALTPAPTPTAALAANDGSFAAYNFGTYFSK